MRRGQGKYGVAPPERRTWRGRVYPSRGQMLRAQELELLERSGAVEALREEVPFPLEVNGVLICTYVADFVYLEHAGGGRLVEVVEDFKGMRTPAYRLKRKLMLAVYGIELRESQAREAAAGARRARGGPRRRAPGR